jgi:acetylornithine aminotransferase
MAGFIRAPFGDVEALRRIAAARSDVVAVLVEPIQGEGGGVGPPADYLPELRALCDEQGWLMMLDEVQTGSGRTGALFNYQHSGVLPDVVTVAKGIANGVPIGACLARGPAAGVLGPGTHGSTFGGNPLAAAAALATLDVLESEGLYERARVLGERIRGGLARALSGDNRIVDIRGAGLMIGIELAEPAGDLVGRALEAGLLLNVTRDNVVRLLPPLVLSDAEADLIVERLAALLARR